MKISAAHYTDLKQAILRNVTKIAAHREFITKEGKAKDIEKRLRWDLMWAGTTIDWRTEAYRDLNDSHIDTALRSIMAEIELKKQITS